MEEGNGPPVQGGMIIVTAMAVGMVVFPAVLYFIREPDPQTPEATTTLYRSILVVVGVIALPVGLIVSNRLSAEAREKKPEILAELKAGRLHQLIFSRFLLGAAFVEGWGLLGAAMFHVTGDNLMLVAPMVAVVALFMTMPSESKTRHLLEAV